MVRTKLSMRPKVAVYKMAGMRLGQSNVFTDNTHVFSLIGKPRKKDGAQRLRCCKYKMGCKGKGYLWPGSLMSHHGQHTCQSTEETVDSRKLATLVKESVIVDTDHSVGSVYEECKNLFSTEATKNVPLDKMESNLYRLRRHLVPNDWQCPQCEDTLDGGDDKPALILPCEHLVCGSCSIESVLDAKCTLCGEKVIRVYNLKTFPSSRK